MAFAEATVLGASVDWLFAVVAKEPKGKQANALCTHAEAPEHCKRHDAKTKRRGILPPAQHIRSESCEIPSVTSENTNDRSLGLPLAIQPGHLEMERT